MKKHVLFVGFLFLGCAAMAQNKTLGVGVSTPNPNAALHVESPTSNQGFILPRLTTAQRTATGFTSVLSAPDNGLMVYDTDLKTIYIWDGAMWKTTGQVAGGAKLAYPYVDTIATAPNNSNLLRMIYAGSATENVGVAHFENLNPNNGFSALFARTNSATNGALDLVVNNTANNNDAIGVTTNGVGRAGSFSVNNASNQSAAIYATTNGTPGAQAALSAAIYAETGTAFSAITARVPSGQSNAISGITVSTDPGSWAGYFSASTGTAVYGTTNSNVGGALAPVGVYGEARGTGSVGGAFWIQNAANNFPALYSNTIGIGSSISANITNASNTAPAVFATTNGTGAAGVFEQTNTGVFSPALQGRTHGLGAAIAGTATSTSTNANASEFVVANPANPRSAVRAETVGTGISGHFINNNGANNSPAILGSTNGGGAGVQAETSTGFTALWAKRDGSSNGNAGIFDITNAGNSYPALQANTVGTGSAASFQVNNASSTAPAVYAQTNGPGSGISADNTSTGDAIVGMKTGSVGSAGNFQITNGSNNASALFGMTNAGNGSAIGAINSGNGNALAIFSGGVRLSTASISASPITTRAAAYLITNGASSYSFDVSVTMNEGDTFYFFNSQATSVTVDGATIPASTGRTFIYIGGALRAF
jgi:hypothetical protein